MSDKDLLFHAVKLCKESECEKYLCLYSQNLGKLPIEEFKAIRGVEELLLSFDRDETVYRSVLPPFSFSSETAEAQHQPLPINLDVSKLKEYYNKNNDLCLELANINKYFRDIKLEKVVNDEHAKRLKVWLFYIYSKFLIFLSLDHNICYNMLYDKDYIIFFKNFFEVKLDGYLNAFAELKNLKSEFLSIINNYQNFLTLLLFNIGESEVRTEDSLLVLFNFMNIFQIFYEINDKYSIVSYKEFYNESVNTNLNIKEECKAFFRLLRKNEVDKHFSIIKYHWLFDAAAKSDILRIYNFGQQRAEIMNSIGDIMEGLNLFNPMGMYLVMEIRRNNLIEDTLNFISNPELNFKKQLRIKFVGEQGIDEGGVKKEFFMLLTRQLFDPAYGMFTYNEVKFE
jgi:hypothetical protein